LGGAEGRRLLPQELQRVYPNVFTLYVPREEKKKEGPRRKKTVNTQVTGQRGGPFVQDFIFILF
jgi:hypothetical protein